LSAFLSGFKASVTSRARRELNLTNIWQRNFYDHIARNEAKIKGFWDYIDDNPRKCGAPCGKKTNCTHLRRPTNSTRNRHDIPGRGGLHPPSLPSLKQNNKSAYRSTGQPALQR